MQTIRRIGCGLTLTILILGVSVFFANDGAASSETGFAIQQNPTPTTAPTPTPVIHTESWRLPFDSAKRIFHGPGQGNHQGQSSEAMDFLLSANPSVTFPVLAVANGVVVDVINDQDFGTVLRINHPSTNSCSFYAHLEPNSVQVAAGAPVVSGQQVANAGLSGTGSNNEIHLHFEARNQCVAGNIFSGNSIPLRAVMGVWWSPWYAPPPAFSEDPDANSGRAEYPAIATPPTEMWPAGARHLSNLDSPPGFPSAYASNISSTQIVLHRGAAPDAPGGITDAYFQTQQFVQAQGWNVLPDGGGHDPTYTRTLNAGEQCSANGQYCFAIRSAFQSDGALTNPRYVDVHPGALTPYISASYSLNETTVTLTYDFPGALRYRVYENHGGETFVAYEGTATQITVNRIVGAENAYTVTVDLGQGGWNQSAWIYLHDEAVTIPTPTFTPSPTPTNTPTPTPSPLLNGLVAYWKLDETSGMRVDATGRGNNLADNNTVGSTIGKVNTAASFIRANNQYLSISDNADLSAGDVDFAIAAWVKLSDKSYNSNLVTKWKSSPSPYTSQEYTVDFSSSANRFRFTVSDGSGWKTVNANAIGSPVTNTWYFIVAWHDSTSNTINIQVNNGLVNSVSHASGIYNSTTDFAIGSCINCGTIYSANGIADEVGFWKRLLTAEERAALYNCSVGTTYPFTSAMSTCAPPCPTTVTSLTDCLVGYWKLEETSGARYDATGRGNDLADNNTVGSTTGKINTAAAFVRANNEYLSIPTNRDLSAGSADFTIAAWVRLDNKTGNQSFVSKWYFAPSNPYPLQEYDVYFSQPVDRLRFTVSDGSGWKTVNADALGSPSANTWYFIVAWHDAANDTINIQVNGGAVNSISHATGVNNTTIDFTIGAEINGGTTFSLGGVVDEVGFWKRLLSSAERMALYNSGNGCTYPFTACSP